MRTRDAVLWELAALERYWQHARADQRVDGWLPFHVRYFRGGDTLPEVRAVKRETIAAHLRKLEADATSPVVVSVDHRGVRWYRLDVVERWPGETLTDWRDRVEVAAYRAVGTELERLRAAEDHVAEALRAQAD